MGQDNTMNQNDPNRRPQQQDNPGQQQQPGQQNQQGDANRQGQAGQGGERIDTDNDGRTRDPNDTRPTDDGGRGEPVQR